MWKSVVCAPAAICLVSSATVWLLSRWVHLATSVLPEGLSVATDAWIVSPAANAVSGVAMVLLASIALPSVTDAVLAGAVTGAAGGGAAGGAVSVGVVGGTTGAGSSLRQPARAAAPTTATSRAWERRVWFMAVSSWMESSGSAVRRRRAVDPCLRRPARARAG